MRRTTYAPARRRNGRPNWHGIATAVFVAGLAILGVHANLSHGISGAAATGSDGFTGRVTRVVDGDTFWISSKDVRIRVWGLDAPERDRPGGAQATATLTRLIDGETLTCLQRDIDRYGRIVGQCSLPDGRDITAAMIASGTASEFCRFSRNHYGTC